MRQSITRRSLLKGVAGAGALAALGTVRGAAASPGDAPKAAPGASRRKMSVSAWVWQFDTDGDPAFVRHVAADRNMRVIVKTHDGLNWMSKWDSSPKAVSGPEQVGVLRDYFGKAGVAFDAWCVPTGVDAVAEAEMCSQVIDAGAGQLYLDLEAGHDGNYWYGSNADATRFGEELRRLQPKATLIVAPDSRPWQAAHVPVAEFAEFCDAIAPQAYWKLFNTEANHRRLAESGFAPAPEGVTPELMMEVTAGTFERYRRKVVPIGDGEASAADWSRFMGEAERRGLEAISVWRFGLPRTDVWDSIAEPAQTPFPEALASARTIFRRWRRVEGLRS